jgi:hypothetical protein
MVANASDVAIPRWNGHASRALPAGDFEHVIVTRHEWSSEWDDLVDHWTRVGIPSRVVTASWIYSNYPGADSQDRLKAFIEDAHTNWGTAYVLLGADTSHIPCRALTYALGTVLSDNWYGDFKPKWSMDVYIGRASVDDTTEIADFIKKTLDYMNNPPPGFGDEVFFMGFDVDDVTPGEDLMIKMKNKYVPASADFSREYDSESGPHEDDCTSFMNGGHAVIAHCGHSATHGLGVGHYRHGDFWERSDASAFTNGGRAGCFYTVGCYGGNFNGNDGWSEELVKNTGGGVVAAIGNTRSGWAWPGIADAYSGTFMRKFHEYLWTRPWFRIAEVEAISKSTDFVRVDANKYLYRELNILGDPALPIWTDEPTALTCTHAGAINRGYSDYAVNVKSGGSDLEGALVCVMMGDRVYERALTDASGNAVLSVKPLEIGNMDVTVTAENHLMYGGTCAVNGPLPDLQIDLELDGDRYISASAVRFALTLTNTTNAQQSCSVWTNFTAPDGGTIPASGYYFGPFPVTLAAGDSKTVVMNLALPLQAPLGTYRFNAFAGPDPVVIDEDHEMFEIVGG